MLAGSIPITVPIYINDCGPIVESLVPSGLEWLGMIGVGGLIVFILLCFVLLFKSC